MLSFLWALPYFHFFAAGLAATVVAMIRSTLEEKPPTTKKRLLDAALCGLGAFSVTWLAWRYSGGLFAFTDSIPYAVPIGFFGAGKVFERLATRIIPPVNPGDK